MDKNIQKILEELYAIDFSLRAHEEKLVPMISKLAASKPIVPLDRAFVSRLKEQLTQVSSPDSAVLSPWQGFAGIKYAFAVIAVLVIAVAVGTLLLFPRNQINQENSSLLAMRIEDADNNAFGRLGALDTSAQPESEKQSAPNNSNAAPFSGASDSTGLSSRTTMMAPAHVPPPGMGIAGGRGGGGVNSSMIAPVSVDQVSYRYVYGGDTFSIEPQASVYQRVKGEQQSAAELMPFLQKFSGGLVNLGSFSGMNIRMLQLEENRDKGYSIKLDMAEGAISINPIWEKWQIMQTANTPLSPSQIPPDNEIIKLAGDFMKAHGINLSAYGTPFVDNQWKVYAMAEDAAESMPIYAPDVVSIIYPLKIDGQNVYEYGGMPQGLSVAINVRDKQVASVSNLTTQHYRKSNYPLETDTAKLIKIAGQGGTMYGTPESAGGKIQNITLGTPERVLLHYWMYTGNEGQGKELEVPALSFPVLDKPSNAPWVPSSAIVPLPKDILDQQSEIISPMQMMKSAPMEGEAKSVPAPATVPKSVPQGVR